MEPTLKSQKNSCSTIVKFKSHGILMVWNSHRNSSFFSRFHSWSDNKSCSYGAHIKPFQLYRTFSKTILHISGGCGKTSLLSKSAATSLDEWFADVRPTNIIRFLGTTPDSSALTPTLISICQQVRLM